MKLSPPQKNCFIVNNFPSYHLAYTFLIISQKCPHYSRKGKIHSGQFSPQSAPSLSHHIGLLGLSLQEPLPSGQASCRQLCPVGPHSPPRRGPHSLAARCTHKSQTPQWPQGKLHPWNIVFSFPIPLQENPATCGSVSQTSNMPEVLLLYPSPA